MSHKQPPANKQPLKKGGPSKQAFQDFYKMQRIVQEHEWEQLIETLEKPLPACFRINYNCAYPDRLRLRLRSEFQFDAGSFNFQGHSVSPPFPLKWYPKELGWQLGCSRVVLRKLGRKEELMGNLHRFLMEESDTGNISRQEAVSMIPPLMLDVQPHHLVLDMCASPGLWGMLLTA
jgi:16S rRNA C967 or C1407 C5-methylase (RsmB/RsmF family)